MNLGLGCASDRRDYHSKGMCLMMRARPARALLLDTPCLRFEAKQVGQ